MQTMCITNTLTGTFILLLSVKALAGTYHELKPSKNRYILHRCTATAELIRRRANQETSHIFLPDNILPKNSQENIQPDNFDDRKQDTNVVSEIHKTQSKLRRTTDPETDTTAPTRDSTSSRFKDSPLKTVNIAGTHIDGPLVFRKKNQLPELKHDVPSSRKLNMSPSVIVIKPSV